MAARYRLGLGRRAVNRIIRALLRLGLGPAGTYLLTVAGQRSGAPRSTPVTLVDDAAPVLKMYVTRVPITRPYFDARPESDLAQFRAEAPRHPVFAITNRP